jgi:hypothetical protein
VETFRVTKRRNHSKSLETVSQAAEPSKDGNDTLVQALTASWDVDEFFTRIPAAQHIPSYSYAGVQSLVHAPASTTQDTGWLEFPTFMTDRWCQEKFPGAHRGGIVSNADLVSLRDGSAAGSSRTTPWLNPRPPIGLPLWSMYGIARKKYPLPFGISRPPAYYVHENKFSSDLSNVTTRNMGIDGMGAMGALIRIVQGLRIRSAMVQANRSLLSLTTLVHREGPFFVESYSLCEFVMNAAQELVRIITVLLHSPQSIFKPEEESATYLVSTITDIYCHVLAFFQLFLEHLTDRAERQGRDPVIPIPGLSFNGTVLTGPCTQGLLFSSSSFYLLERLGNVLGLEPMSGGVGLLSTNQIDVLCDSLDGSEDLAQGEGIMRPADLRNLYAKVATVLEQLSVYEQ